MLTLLKKYFLCTLVIVSSVALFAHASGNYDFLNLENNSAWVPEWTRAYDIIRIEDAWNAVTSSSLPLVNVTIGIIDTGVDVGHPEFTSHGDLTNTVLFGTTPASAKKDADGHGTSIAGIIGANNISALGVLQTNSPQTNGILSGVLPVSKYTLEVRDLLSAESLFFESIKDIFMQSQLLHADVVNISRGYAKDKTLPDNYPDSYLNKNTFFYSRVFPKFPNTLFVFSAGNDGTNVENQTPANINLDNTMTVGATGILGDQFDKRFVHPSAVSSNFGAGVDISAPGVVYAPTTRGKGELSGGNYTLFNSTSASAPLVTGVAGLLKAIKPSLTPSNIKDILIRTADPITTDQPIGGRLNAYNAICDSQVGLNCETNENPVAFFEGWESLSLGHPLCETLPPYTSGDVCAFTADSGKWVVSESVPVGSPISSVDILPGKILKLKPQTHYSNGFLSREIRTAGDMLIPITQTATVSFTDFAVIPSNIPSRADFFVSFHKDGLGVCPSTGETIFTTSIWYVLNDTTGIPPEEFPIPPCTARVFLPPSSSFSRNFHDDFANFLPFSSDGWNVSDMMLQIVSLESPVREVAVTWDNVMIMR